MSNALFCLHCPCQKTGKGPPSLFLFSPRRDSPLSLRKHLGHSTLTLSLSMKLRKLERTDEESPSNALSVWPRGGFLLHSSSLAVPYVPTQSICFQYSIARIPHLSIL